MIEETKTAKVEIESENESNADAFITEESILLDLIHVSWYL